VDLRKRIRPTGLRNPKGLSLLRALNGSKNSIRYWPIADLRNAFGGLISVPHQYRFFLSYGHIEVENFLTDQHLIG
jgi:hypothetical protein